MFDDDYFPSSGSGGIDTGITDQFEGISEQDISESIGMALGDVASEPWAAQAFTSLSSGKPGEDAIARAAAAQPRAISATDAGTNEKGGILGKISSWVDKNKGLSEILARGIAGAAGANSNKKAAEVAAQSRLDELKLRNQQEMEANARTSASVSGLREPQGIVGRAQLRRFDGAPVYQNGRIA